MTNRQKGIAGIVLLFIILIGDIIGGVGGGLLASRAPAKIICDNTSAQTECGTSSGTATAVNTLTVTQTYPLAFAKKPFIQLTPITASGVVISNDIVIPMLETDPALVLLNVPAADTEIPNHRMQMNAGMVAGQTFSFCFEVTVVGLTALGKIKYSLDSGVTWNDFSQLTTVPLWNTVGLQCALESQTSSIAGALVAPFTTGGAGAGDSPAVTNISMDYIVGAWGWISITVRSTFVTPTQFQWQARSLAVFSQTIKIGWTATACQSGGVAVDCPAE